MSDWLNFFWAARLILKRKFMFGLFFPPLVSFFCIFFLGKVLHTYWLVWKRWVFFATGKKPGFFAYSSWFLLKIPKKNYSLEIKNTLPLVSWTVNFLTKSETIYLIQSNSMFTFSPHMILSKRLYDLFNQETCSFEKCSYF